LSTIVFVVDAKGREKEVYEGDKTKAKKIDQVGIEFVTVLIKKYPK
jgi:hypothetical protein